MPTLTAGQISLPSPSLYFTFCPSFPINAPLHYLHHPQLPRIFLIKPTSTSLVSSLFLPAILIPMFQLVKTPQVTNLRLLVPKLLLFSFTLALPSIFLFQIPLSFKVCMHLLAIPLFVSSFLDLVSLSMFFDI